MRRSEGVKRTLKIVCFIVVLPFVLTFPYFFIAPPSTLMIADILSFHSVKRDWVSLDQISPNLIEAVVSSEDDAFCDHYGFDFNQMGKSIKEARARHQPVKATSTITMQTAKNLFLWQGHSWIRKGFEAPLTVWLELMWTKRRILEVYLNIVEWGDGIYGAEAAARHHFGVSARALTRHQAALLAASLPNPIERVAGHPGPGLASIASSLENRVIHGGPVLDCLH